VSVYKLYVIIAVQQKQHDKENRYSNAGQEHSEYTIISCMWAEVSWLGKCISNNSECTGSRTSGGEYHVREISFGFHRQILTVSVGGFISHFR